MKPEAHGPDVSHYQHVTDPAAIPRFRMASCKLSEGRGGTDRTARMWVPLFRSIGVTYIGVYHWLRSDSPADVQAAVVIQRCRELGLENNGRLLPGYMIQLDWETTPGIPNVKVDEVERFTAVLRDRWGERQITYASDWVPGFFAWRQRNPTAPLWYANYRLVNDSLGGWQECLRYGAAVWQWTSTYKCPGIASGTPGRPETDRGIDMNHVLSWATLDRICAVTATPPPVPPPPRPVPVPVPDPPQEDEMVIITNAEAWTDFDGQPQGVGAAKLVLMDDGTLRHLGFAEWQARGSQAGHAWTNQDIATAGRWRPSAVNVELPPLTLNGTITGTVGG